MYDGLETRIAFKRFFSSFDYCDIIKHIQIGDLFLHMKRFVVYCILYE